MQTISILVVCLYICVCVFEKIFGIPICVFQATLVCFSVVHLEEGKFLGYGVVNTCSFAGLFLGVRRSSVSFVFSFKILILAMKPGCVELQSLPSNHMQELRKKKSSGALKMTALLNSKKPFPRLPRICNLSLSFFRKEKVKRKSILGDT